jgi:hypothetical protein
MGPEPVVGSVTPDQGALYLLQAGREPVTEVSPVSISNGLAWSKDNTQLYYIDTATGQVDVFDFDLERAKIGEYCCCSRFSSKASCVSNISGSYANCYVIGKGRILVRHADTVSGTDECDQFDLIMHRNPHIYSPQGAIIKWYTSREEVLQS